jgi:predicted CopG family antitoxin
MIKTSIDLTRDQYQFLKLKALQRKMRGEDPSFVTILRELIEENVKKGTFPSQVLPKQKPKERMIKTSIDLASDQYEFLKMKALERKMRGEDPSFVTILRELIEKDRKQ